MGVCKRCFISGRVQGVFYRASTCHEAEQLGITGYARNLDDGRVEVLGCGIQSSLDDFCAWLAQGPTHAEVTHITCESVNESSPVVFAVE